MLSIDYWDVLCLGLDPEWDFGDWHHAVLGAQLTTDSGPVTVTCTATFDPCGVEVLLEPIARHLQEGGSQRVGPGADSRWKAFLGQPVRDARVRWDRFTIGPTTRSNGAVVDADIPTALRLDFDGGPVWFVAGTPQFREPYNVFIPGDQIVVVFAASKMRQMGYVDPTFAD
ncbi:hypothetical protein AB0M46_09355 [Dactylosporangium sp. NPDC051485]|uniref:hypothetical protein n=1 Tax=Dactylosporangium sp. NPDC051485 TaxID=3154846 RepID=UPI0034326CD6